MLGEDFHSWSSCDMKYFEEQLFSLFISFSDNALGPELQIERHASHKEQWRTHLVDETRRTGMFTYSIHFNFSLWINFVVQYQWISDLPSSPSRWGWHHTCELAFENHEFEVEFLLQCNVDNFISVHCILQGCNKLVPCFLFGLKETSSMWKTTNRSDLLRTLG